MTPPAAKQKTHLITLHNDTRNDEYAWLRDPDWQQVMRDPGSLNAEIRAYLEAENAYTQAWMQDTETLQATLFNEMKNRIKEDDASVACKDGDFYYYYRYEAGGEHPLYCRRTKNRQEQVLLNADSLAEDFDYFDMGECRHSPDHRYFAYCVDTTGSEFYRLYILDLDTGRHLEETIENIQGNFVWAMDSRTLFYTTLNASHRPDKVFRRHLGAALRQDTLVYQEHDSGFFVTLDRTESNRFILISAHDHTSSEIHYLDAHQPRQAAKLFQARGKDIEYAISDHDSVWYITTNADGCRDFKLMQTPLHQTQRQYWQNVYLPAKGTLLSSIYLFRRFMVRHERTQGLARIVIVSLEKDRREYAIEFDEEAYELSINPGFEFDTSILRFSYMSMTTPRQIFDFDMDRRRRQLRKQQQVPCGHDPQEYVTRRIFATAKDGAKIPVSVLYHKDSVLDGSAPLLLYGYGAYGINMPAGFSTRCLSLVKRGFIYAIAHIRGGMELGYDWYTGGKLKNKKNTFTDFIAAAEYLVEQNYTRAGKISALGGSAGGLLIGAVINMRPALFHSAIARVPFVDVLNTICDGSLPLTPPEWPEWGNPIKNADDYDHIKTYSPYDQVHRQAYPHLLVTAGLTDPRVTYWEPAKWVARLRRYKTDNNALLLKTNMQAGHTGASGRFADLKEVALMYAFILKLHQL